MSTLPAYRPLGSHNLVSARDIQREVSRSAEWVKRHILPFVQPAIKATGKRTPNMYVWSEVIELFYRTRWESHPAAPMKIDIPMADL